MSLNASIKDLDILTLSQKIRRLEYWFRQGQEYITDEQLDNYNMIKERIKELNPEYCIGKDQIFSIDVDGTRVIGKITLLEKFDFEVDILYPYKNWKNPWHISGLGRGTPNHFLKTYKKRSVVELRESYKKLKMIDDNIDQIVKVHDNLNEEIQLVTKLEDSKVKDRVISKLNDWFYNGFIFTSSVTGMIGTISDVPQIEDILKIYKKEKRKIYLSR